ncbi:Mur ligase domain-containing protein [Kitasatospora sp. NPDC087315]|uniref:Mur ligase domain-containing protein n=1 Tax=Kitasatospora sp. NPDC087315 TaxID=3364069 RepID=UPI00381472C3
MDTVVQRHTHEHEGATPATGLPDVLTRAHLVDVAVPGMAGLAQWLAGRGADVTGSVAPGEEHDRTVEQLTAAGVRIMMGSKAGHVTEDRTAVVWSGVVVGPHPELDRAQQLGLPVLARTHALAAACAQAGPEAVAVGGSHSTATAAAVLAAALDDGRTGWILTAPARGLAAGHGAAGRLVVDFCPDTATHEAAPPGAWQHRPSRHYLVSTPKPAVALITATAATAPHYTDNIEGLDAAERLARSAGTVVLPSWDSGVRILRERLTFRPGPRIVTVGLADTDEVRVLAPRWTGVAYHLTLQHDGAQYAFVLPLAGRHHAMAACAAIATALVAGEDASAIAERLVAFGGVDRSLAGLGTQAGITVVDSRARHPREVAEDVAAARMLTEGSVIAVLQPDGFARATAHAAELGAALAEADRAVLLPVSTPLTSVHADDPLDTVAEAAREALGADAVHRIRSGPHEPGTAELIASLTEPDDLVLVIGTTDAARLGPRLLARLAAPTTPVPSLTGQDIALLVLVAAGAGHGTIAADPTLALERHQVGDAIRALLARTGTRTVLQLAAWATARRIITDSAEPCAALAVTPCLAPRPRQILRGWAGGRSTPELAADFGVTPATMRAYTRTLLSDLGVGSQAQASVVGVLAGLTLLSDIDPAWPSVPLDRATRPNGPAA